MKSLWIVNKACGAMHQKKYGTKSTGGLWLDAMLEQAKQYTDDEIVVVNIEKVPKICYLKDGNIVYYTLSGERNYKYDYKSVDAIKQWKEIIEKEKPDIIELWGTEFPFGLAALKAVDGIPSVIFVQGILESIARYYLSGLSKSELKKAVTLRDVVTRNTIIQVQNQYYQRSKYEIELIKKSGNIIIENNWSNAYYHSVMPGVNSYRMPISISDNFKKKTWDENNMIPYTIMCPESYYPIKGIHMLLKALKIVKCKYPEVQLYIPGLANQEPRGIKQLLKQNGYSKLVLSMIKEYNLNSNVHYVGRLTAEEMADKMTSVNCFVMCSSIENHSSTLKEAMSTGVPCIASYVGGVPEYANDDNCLLYRFEDYELLASNIMRLFEERELRNKLSKAAKNTMVQFDKIPSGYKEMRSIFTQCIIKSKG